MPAEPIGARYGVAAREGEGLSGLAFLRGIVEGRLPHPPISQTLRFWLVSAEEGSAAFEGEPGESVLNPAGTVHGGWALTLIDSACGCAALSLLPEGVGYTTVETKGNLSRPILTDTGRIRCEARVLAHGRQIISAEAKVVALRTGKLLAHGTSTLAVIGR